MKMNFFMCALTGVALVSTLSSCHSNESKVERAEEKVEEAKQEVAESKEELQIEYNNFKAEMEAQIEANERRIDELQNLSAKQPADQRDAYKARIQDLRDRNDALRKRIQEYKAAERKEDWEEFKREYKHDMDELDKAFGSIGSDNVK